MPKQTTPALCTGLALALCALAACSKDAGGAADAAQDAAQARDAGDHGSAAPDAATHHPVAHDAGHTSSGGAHDASLGAPDAAGMARDDAGMHDAGSAPPPDAGSNACGGEKPGPDNTGVPDGVTLTPSGSIQVMQDGEVVEGLDIAGTITVLANDVTIRNVRITTGDYYPVRYFDNHNTGLVVEDSEIAGTSGNATSGIAFTDYTARRLNIHGTADGLKADSNVLIEDCYIHDLSNGDGEHNDGVQSTGGKGVTIRHNAISGASNACVQTGDENAATEDLTIECNWLSGGGYALNIRGQGDTRPKNTKILDNRFGRDSGYGPWTIDDPDPIVEGNVYDDDGEPIAYP